MSWKGTNREWAAFPVKEGRVEVGSSSGAEEVGEHMVGPWRLWETLRELDHLSPVPQDPLHPEARLYQERAVGDD